MASRSRVRSVLSLKTEAKRQCIDCDGSARYDILSDDRQTAFFANHVWPMEQHEIGRLIKKSVLACVPAS